MNKLCLHFITTLSFLCIASAALCSEFDSELLEIQKEWATANYQLKGDSQKKAFEALMKKTEAFIDSNPGSAEPLIWDGIVNSTYAGVKGGAGALKYAKKARKHLEAAINIYPDALDGSAYTSLGTLYYKVPGFPIGFGSNMKAEQNLKKALEINPNGIDPNYFYGDFLIDRKRYDEAVVTLNKAKAAQDRPLRPIADKGRRKEIEQALILAQSKTK